MATDEGKIEEKLGEITKLLESLLRHEKARYPAPIGPRPEIDLYNVGKFILNIALPPGKWTTIWEVEKPTCPIMIYWKVVVTDSPLIKCLCFQDNYPVCGEGCDLAALYTLGITNYNDRGWCHLYDTTNNLYGLQCNILRPIKEKYTYKIQNYDNAPHNLIVCYPKWYRWTSPAA